VSKYTVEPGARLLWSLRRSTSDVRCVLFSQMMPIEVHVLQDRDLVIKEIFVEEWAALGWANAYGDRLKQHGWRDSPEDYTPSSAA
jgi:hypothetical protein